MTLTMPMIAENPYPFRRLRLMLIDDFFSGTAPDYSRFRSLGIPIDEILKFEPYREIYLQRMAFDPPRWRFDAAGKMVVLVPCLDLREEQVDFVAVPLDGSPAFALFGRVPVLGLDQLMRPQVPGRMPVQETPLEWLRRGADGCCVLDWEGAAPILRSQPVSFLAGSPAIARRLRESGVETKIFTRRIRQEQAA